MLTAEAARNGEALSGEPARGVAALWYATQLRWPIFPCKPGGKEPLIKNPARNASRNPQVIADWWERYPKANPATPMGSRTEMFTVDVDGEPGEQSLRDLQARYGPLLVAAPMQITGSGNGLQILFRLPRDRTIRNSVSKVGDHVDIRGEGGYIVLAPSAHPSGGEYRWILGCGPWEISPPPAPSWFLDQLDPSGVANDPVRPDPLPGVPEGRRDNALFTFLKDHAEHCSNVEELLALADAFNATCRPPNDPARARLTANSVWVKYHLTGRILKKGEEARVLTPKSAFERIITHEKGADALTLDMALRFAHAGRDEPFALVPEAMAAKGVIPHWGWRRYRNARAALIELGRIELVSEGGRRRHDPHRYLLRSQ